MSQFITKLFLVSLVLVLAVVPALAEEDGRINVVAHLGGNAVYCVDADLIAANSYAEGGIQVLSADGQELLFVPAADIDAAGDEIAVHTLVGEGNGLSLYRLVEGGFQLNGFDEHGKLYEFAFAGCDPVGSALSGDVNSDTVADDEPEGVEGVEGPTGPQGPEGPQGEE